MHAVIEFVIENVAYIALGASVVIANLLNKPKTAEQLAKAKAKQKEKLLKKGEKLVAKMSNVSSKLDELNNEKKDGE